jgi:uncharacterized protein (DUF1786 family)
VFATPDAARSFNDDLEIVKSFGITLVSEDEGERLSSDVVRIALKDFNFGMIEEAFAQFHVSLHDLDLIATAVFDHGAAPPGFSDRQFRFDFIADRVEKKPFLTTFAFKEDEIPSIMTRMNAVAETGGGVGLPFLAMDTAPAAVLGAMQDLVVAGEDEFLMTNVGNFHTIGFHISDDQIKGVFEHHTGLLDSEKLDNLLIRLGDGSLSHEEVFNDHGHGALIISPLSPNSNKSRFGVAVTGPRWRMMQASSLSPHFASPHGDMMMAGCFGLVRAAADHYPEYQEEILAALGKGREKPPWELD